MYFLELFNKGIIGVHLKYLYGLHVIIVLATLEGLQLHDKPHVYGANIISCGNNDRYPSEALGYGYPHHTKYIYIFEPLIKSLLVLGFISATNID